MDGWVDGWVALDKVFKVTLSIHPRKLDPYFSQSQELLDTPRCPTGAELTKSWEEAIPPLPLSFLLCPSPGRPLDCTVLHSAILRGSQWSARSTDADHVPCYFYITHLQPKEGRWHHLELAAEMVGFKRHLWVPEASLQYGCGLRHRAESEKSISLNSPAGTQGRSKVKAMGFPAPQSCPFISKTLHRRGTLLNDSLLATFVPQKILVRRVRSLWLWFHNDLTPAPGP